MSESQETNTTVWHQKWVTEPSGKVLTTWHEREACEHEAYPNLDEGVSTEGYDLVGFLCRLCGTWVKA